MTANPTRIVVLTMIVKLAQSILLSAVLSIGTQAAYANNRNETLELLQFLTSNAVLNANGVPNSYAIGDGHDIANYFGDFVCRTDNSCEVTDTIYESPFAILGDGLPPKTGSESDIRAANAQAERVNMAYGTDIYDAATWEIALALGAKNNLLDSKQVDTLISTKNKALRQDKVRATSKAFSYGYQKPIIEAKHAFIFRMIAPDFVVKDPFFNTRYQDGLNYDYDPVELADNDGEHDEEYYKYVVTWSDWKPITGENAWAQLIGPLQAVDLIHKQVSADSPALQNAINSLYAFSSMQSAVGGIYYAPGGSLGNTGPITRGEISIENNFSVLGGLQVLNHRLKQSRQTDEVKKAQSDLHTLLYGGKTVNGYETLGLLSFLYNGAFDHKHGVFLTHGLAQNPSNQHAWQPDDSDNARAMAVDVNTWGIAALGPETIDRWYGDGTALSIWQQVKDKGGYYNDKGEFQGVGFTLKNREQDKIMSSEWTAGAINALYLLIPYYQDKGVDVSHLKADLANMQLAIKGLREDNYQQQTFDGQTKGAYLPKINKANGLGYYYASKRFDIPFGWWANTIPSITANSWVVMNHYHFNPFQYQGALSGEHYITPEARDIEGSDSSLPQSVKVSFNAGDLGPIKKLSLSYQRDDNNWQTAATTDNREATAFLPKGTSKLSLSYYTDNWYGACQVSPANLLCQNENCTTTKAIKAHFSADGLDECTLVQKSH